MQDERYGNYDDNANKEENVQNAGQNEVQDNVQGDSQNPANEDSNANNGYYGQADDSYRGSGQNYSQNDGNYNGNQGYGQNNYNGFNGWNGQNNQNGYNNFNQPQKNNNSGKKKIAIAACVAAVLGILGIAGAGVSGVISYLVRYSEDSNKIAWENQDKSESVTDKADSPESTTAPVSVTEAGASVGALTDVSGIVEAVMPSVVSITSTSSVQGYSIFGQRYEQEISSAGTGFIVGENDDELLLATNNHVVEDATAIQVTFTDESTAQAVVKGTDAQADLAVVAVKKEDIKSETKDVIKVAVLGDSDSVKVGQIAIAIGNAQGMGQSVTVGYISAKDRELDMSDSANGGTKTMNFLQTDAAINGGNSGGPLVDIKGNVVGINSAKISDTQVEGMCFA
ncbi:MAG: trypsin-like peptidase domain-containing protein, partial [Lachnospiraceae bacterium]|nr:trypsin-like peptidase domain-containing protein [Lachnospiraceae bacterium]